MPDPGKSDLVPRGLIPPSLTFIRKTNQPFLVFPSLDCVFTLVILAVFFVPATDAADRFFVGFAHIR